VATKQELQSRLTKLEEDFEKLQRHETLFEATEQFAVLGPYEWNYERDCLESCSEQYARIFNMTIPEALSAHRNWASTLEQIHPEDLDLYKEKCDFLRDSKSLDVKYRVELEDGTVKHLHEIGVVVTDLDGSERGTFGIIQDISSQTKYDRDLHYRDALAEQTELITDIGQYIYDELNEKYLYLSNGFARIHKTESTTYVNKTQSVEDDLSDIHPEDRDRVAKEYLHYISSKNNIAIEYRIIREDGNVRWIREMAKAQIIDNGNVIQTVGVIQDITERVNHEQELLFVNAMAHHAESIVDIGYFLYDEQKDENIYISPGNARIIGQDVDYYMDNICNEEDFINLVHPEDQQKVHDAYHYDLHKDGGWEVEYRVRRPDGELRWILEVGKAHKWNTNGIEQSIGVIQDITRQKRIEEELRFKDALANQAEAITDIGHYVYDEIREVYLFASPGLARIHDVGVDDLTGKNISKDANLKMIYHEDQKHVSKVYNDFMITPEPIQVDYRIQRKNGEIRWIRQMARVHLMNRGIVEQTIGVLQDITSQKSAEQEILESRHNLEQQVVERTRELANTVNQLREEIDERKKITAELDFLANHDALTGLPSLRLCKDRLDRSLADSRRNRQTSAVMFMDLDGFKAVNDSYGHDTGDRVLRSVAERIQTEIRETDTVARIGGDEFVVILSRVPNMDIISRIASNLVTQISQPIILDNIEIMIGSSLGIALYPRDGLSAEELIRKADKAMYVVKNNGKNNYGFFKLDDNSQKSPN
jgi:diguanylate cyclase (GGDEF)-like protein/PAS domain S-box-containing protein